MILDTVVALGLKVLDKVIPDPAAKAEAQYKLLQLQQQGSLAELEADTRLALAQAEINRAEAGNPSLLVSGWRPGAGWIAVAGLGYEYLLHPLLAWLSPLAGLPAPPSIETADLLLLLGGMLGLGTLRTAEKIQGVAAK